MSENTDWIESAEFKEGGALIEIQKARYFS